GAGSDFQIVVSRNRTVYARRLRLDADIAAAHRAFANQLAGDELRGIDGDGKAKALGRQDGRGVNADDFSLGIHQGASGVAGVESSVGLNDVFDQAPRLRAQAPAQRANHAGSHRVLETVRVADRDH